MYCGLTIGIMGMDATTLEIIAEAGSPPDSVYAGNILPLRKLGHQLLVVLLLGNMLTLVLTSQLVAAILNSSVFINFIASTSLILIFGEIIPMSICSNGKYALFLGSASIPVLRLSLVVLYPVARPLGLLLDCLVPHEAGEVFDRAELKKLISLHSEKFAFQTGMGKEESKMILSALELRECSARDVMTPLDKVKMMESSTVINANLEQTLWEWGKSRIPVYSGSRSTIVGLLYVKSLIGVFNKDCPKDFTIANYLSENAADIALINDGMSLLHALALFEKNQIQLLFVTSDTLEDGTPLFPPSAEDRAVEDDRALQTESYRLIPKDSMMMEELSSFQITGILTLEDVIEKLISSDILDEDECDSGSDCNEGTETDSLARRVPSVAPRINFYSFGIPEAPSEKSSLSSDQHWVLAQFLSRSYVLFATWSIPHIMMLLSEVGDRIIWPEENSATLKNLYNAQVKADFFTLVLSGGVLVRYDASIETEIRSFISLGDEILISGQPFVPPYTATVSRPSRLLSISLHDLKKVEDQVNKLRLCHREAPIRLLPFGEDIQIRFQLDREVFALFLLNTTRGITCLKEAVGFAPQKPLTLSLHTFSIENDSTISVFFSSYSTFPLFLAHCSSYSVVSLSRLMDTEEGEFIVEGHSTPEDAKFDEIVGAIETFMISFDMDAAMKEVVPPLEKPDTDHERHIIYRKLLDKVDKELNTYVHERCSIASLEEVAELLASRKEEISEEVWDFVSDSCFDYQTFIQKWEALNNNSKKLCSAQPLYYNSKRKLLPLHTYTHHDACRLHITIHPIHHTAMSSDFFSSNHFLWGPKRRPRTTEEISKLWSNRETLTVRSFHFEERVAIRLLLYGVVGEAIVRQLLDGLLLPPPFCHTNLDYVEWTSELLSGVVESIPQELDAAIILMPLILGCRMGSYDARLRSACRRLCSILSLPFQLVEKEEELIVSEALQLVHRKEEVGGSNVLRRAATIGGFAALGGMALTFTGGLAAPLIAPAFGAVVSGVTASLAAVGSVGAAVLGSTGLAAGFAGVVGAASHAAALSGLLTPVLTVANVTAIFGASVEGSLRSSSISDETEGSVACAYAHGSLAQESIWGAISPFDDGDDRRVLPGLLVPHHLRGTTMSNVAVLPALRKRLRKIIFSVESRIPNSELRLRALLLESGMWTVEPPKVIPVKRTAVFAAANRFGRPTGTTFALCYSCSISGAVSNAVKSFRVWIRVSVDVLGFYYTHCFVEDGRSPFCPEAAGQRLSECAVSPGSSYQYQGIFALFTKNDEWINFILSDTDPAPPEGRTDALPTIFPTLELDDRRKDYEKVVRKVFRRYLYVAVTNKTFCTVERVLTRVVCGETWESTPFLNERVELEESSLHFITNSKWSLKGAEILLIFKVHRFRSEKPPVFIRLHIEKTALNKLMLSSQASLSLQEMEQMESPLSYPQDEFQVPLEGSCGVVVKIRVREDRNGVEVVIEDGVGLSCDRPALTIAVTGYMGIFDPRRSGEDQQLAFWEPIVSRNHHFRATECYVLHWEQQYQSQLAEAIHANVFSADLLADNAAGVAKSVAKKSLMHGTLFSGFLAYQAFMSSMLLPMSALWATDAIDNAYSSLSNRAAAAGKELATALLSTCRGRRPISFVGFSFGSCVICHCLIALYEQNAFDVVENVFSLAPHSAPLRITAGRLVNVYSSKDWMLWLMNKANTSLVSPVAGLMPIALPGVENVDITVISPHHAMHASKVQDILSSIEEFPTDQIWESRRRHGAFIAFAKGKQGSVFSLQNDISLHSAEKQQGCTLALTDVELCECSFAYSLPAKLSTGETGIFSIIGDKSERRSACFSADVILSGSTRPILRIFFSFKMEGDSVGVGIKAFSNLSSGAATKCMMNEIQMEGVDALTSTEKEYHTEFVMEKWFEDGSEAAVMTISCRNAPPTIFIRVVSLLSKDSTSVERLSYPSMNRNAFLLRKSMPGANSFPPVARVEAVELLQARVSQMKKTMDSTAVVVVNCSDLRIILDDIALNDDFIFLQLPPTELPPKSFSIFTIKILEHCERQILLRYVLEEVTRGYHIFIDCEGTTANEFALDAKGFTHEDHVSSSAAQNLHQNTLHVVVFSPEALNVSSTVEKELSCSKWLLFE
eukprot:gene12511-8567_t